MESLEKIRWAGERTYKKYSMSRTSSLAHIFYINLRFVYLYTNLSKSRFFFQAFYVAPYISWPIVVSWHQGCKIHTDVIDWYKQVAMNLLHSYKRKNRCYKSYHADRGKFIGSWVTQIGRAWAVVSNHVMRSSSSHAFFVVPDFVSYETASSHYT